MTTRRSTRLAMAVSSILAAPAIATGFGLVATLGVAPEARAQETATQVTGTVVDAAGAPVGGAQVTLLHVPTGTVATATTTPSGQFVATGLRVGGPFTVTAQASGYASGAVENVYTELGRRVNVTLAIQPVAELAAIEVVGQGERAAAVGVGSDFDRDRIAAIPSIARDPKNALSIDPKAFIDPTNSDALEVAGVNNRYNSLTVDGVRQNDDFGLNNNGYPTQRSPISIDAIEQVSLLTAPFDVQYSNFRGSTINIVTKSGTNEFEGSAFYYTYDDGLVGDKSKGQDLKFSFDQETYGFTLGGPILKDRLFFFTSYEKLEREAPQEFGAGDSDAAITISGTTQAEYDQVVQITRDVYGFDPLDVPSTLPAEDEKILAKIDWNITDGHRASLSYQRTEGNEVIQSNNSTNFRELSTPSTWYDRSILMETYSLQVFSDWTQTFSTEVKIGRKEVETQQVSLNGTEFANMRVTTPGGGTIIVGPDISRHANQLTNDLDQAKLKGILFLGDHTISGGVEYESLDIFNLFVQRAEGEYYFNSIADYAAQRAQRLRYGNAFTNDKNDAAAAFSYDVLGFFLQDQWRITPDLEIQYGLRYDTFSSSDEPNFNQNFVNRYGYSNQETLDGRDLLMPRFGFNWAVADQTIVRGGVGLFGGGSPNVWISNSFSNDGVTVVSQDFSRPGSGIEPRLDNVDGFDLPQAVLDTHETLRGDGGVNAVAPGFEIPSQWRYNLGLEHTFENGWRVNTDVVYSRVKDEVVWFDARLVQTGTAPDGRPIYGKRPGDSRAFTTQDLILDNTSDGEGLVFSVELDKRWDTSAGRFDLFLGYANQDIKDINSATSSTANSNWGNVGTSVANDPGLAASNYDIEHRFSASLNWRKAFFGEYFTSAGLFMEHRSGRAFSYTFGGASLGVFGDPANTTTSPRQLLYVPLVDDPNVVYSSDAFRDAVNAFIDSSELAAYRGQIAPRNAFRSPWITLANLRLSQEIPTGIPGTRGVLTLDIENLTNLLNDDWGRVSQVPFPYFAPVLETSINANGQYVYRPRQGTTAPTGPDFSVSALPSVYRVQLGIRIEF
ncbi:MAG: TonB-dependent receptor [Steroidobacteraceae bacterium]|jgi:hypothetical protein|nr:TonB-dependent receptor [Steroidobacteraceae bacterium]